MEEQVKRLVDTTWVKLQETPADRRLLIAIAGAPGSGKTTLSKLLTKAINDRHLSTHPNDPSIAAFIPMDGYHYSRAQLDTFPNAEEAHRRRGSDFTFDGEGFVNLVKKAAAPLTEETEDIYAPSFDHAIKDPVEKTFRIGRENKVVVFEGNYILLPNAPWSNALPLYSLKFFIRAPEPTLRARLAARHLAAGIVPTFELGQARADFNDIPNGRQIQEGLLAHPTGTVDVVLESREDDTWAPTASR